MRLLGPRVLVKRDVVENVGGIALPQDATRVLNTGTIEEAGTTSRFTKGQRVMFHPFTAIAVDWTSNLTLWLVEDSSIIACSEGETDLTPERLQEEEKRKEGSNHAAIRLHK